MPRVKFNTVLAYDTKTAWGYDVEVAKDGVFGFVPDELLATEVSAGRVKVLEAPVKVAEVTVKADEPTNDVEPVLAAQDVVENGSGKRMGRPPKKAE